MPLHPGTRLGPYEVTAQIGVGGMGEVYKATDTNLKRMVAIKVLPMSVALDAERLARFQREAEMLASLNHPNIAAIYGLERSGGITALVMELVEGLTLADRIAQGALPIDEALPIAKQIAEALEAAHEQGIIHRDLKPTNIKVRPDGTVKVLDFGLAKAMEPSSVMSASVSQAPTITSPAMMTGVGVILGTAAYMSPEQAKGLTVDRRGDVWAFGAVLYEMLTGRRAFGGNDVSDTLAEVLKGEPDWTRLPPGLPSAIRTLLRRCLSKDRRQRLDSAAAARLEIDDAMNPTASDASESPVSGRAIGWRRAAAVSISALVIGMAGAGTVTWFALRPSARELVRTAIATPGATALRMGTGDFGPYVAITSDGSRIVYAGAEQLLMRALDQLQPSALATSRVVQGLFASPDDQRVGFFEGGALKSVGIAGGAVRTLVPLDGLGHGATWGADDSIVFATGSLTTGLQRVSAEGGEVTVLTTPDNERGEADHLWPEFLPDGQSVLFTITSMTGGLDAAEIAVRDLRSGTQTVLLRGGSHARYLPTGHLLYGAKGGLRAVAFDLGRRMLVGTPVTVLPSVATSASGGVEAATAKNGTLVYLPGGAVTALAPRTLVWVDRTGDEFPLGTPLRAYQHPRLSPDGKRVVVYSGDGEQDLWVWDLARTTLNRLTFDPAVDQAPIWTPDSRRILLGSSRAGTSNIYIQPADDGTRPPTRLTDSPEAQFPTSLTSDGSRAIVNQFTATQARNLHLLTLTPTPRITLLLGTRFDERGGVVSPDGRWLAYESDSSGRYEVYVRRFPDVNDGLWQVSTGGGVQPLWARNGQELFYAEAEGRLMAVSVHPSSYAWSADAPVRLFDGPYVLTAQSNLRQYDVSANSQRFLMVKETPASAESAVQIIIVQNWFEELKRLAPRK